MDQGKEHHFSEEEAWCKWPIGVAMLLHESIPNWKGRSLTYFDSDKD